MGNPDSGPQIQLAEVQYSNQNRPVVITIFDPSPTRLLASCRLGNLGQAEAPPRAPFERVPMELGSTTENCFAFATRE